MKKALLVLFGIFFLAFNSCKVENETLSLSSVSQNSADALASSIPSLPRDTSETEASSFSDDFSPLSETAPYQRQEKFKTEEVLTVSSSDGWVLRDIIPYFEVGNRRETRVVSEDSLLSLQYYPLEIIPPFPETLPIYVDNFPSTRHGLPIYTITDDDMLLFENQLREYINILFGEGKASAYEIVPNPVSEDSVELEYDSDTSSFGSSRGTISINTDDFNLAEDIDNECFMENIIITSAIEYLGIKTPKVHSEIPYAKFTSSPEGIYSVDSYNYIITEATDNYAEDAYNRAFNYIKIMRLANSSGALVFIQKDNMGKPAEERKVVPFEQVQSYISKKYSYLFNLLGDGIEIKTELCYRKKVEYGYCVPCYKYYVKVGEVQTDVLQGDGTYIVPIYDVTYIAVTE